MKKAEKLFKDLLNENLGYVDLKPITTIESSPKTNYEIKYAEYLAEETKKAKEDEDVPVVSKKESKHVEEVDSHAFDYADLNNIDNLNAEEFSKGVYFEMNKVRETVSDANIGEAIAKARKVVAKNLAKDSLFYIKNAAFGVEGLGYQETELEEVSGKYAASGYSDKLKKVVKESLMGESSIDAAELAIQASQAKAGMDEEARPDYPDVDKDGDKEESMEKALKDKKAKKMKKESIDSKLAEIGKEAEAVKLEAQLDYLHEYIQEKVDRVSSINEDDNLKELIDKTKMKQMQREIKDLERKKAKMERIYEKSCGKKYAKKEMMDEVDAINEALNKELGKFGPDLKKRLESAGFKTGIFQGEGMVPVEAQKKIQNDPSLAGIAYKKYPDGYEFLEVSVNKSKLKELEKVANYFSTPEGEYGPDKDTGWVIKNVRNVNPGDIYRSKLGGMNNLATIRYFRSEEAGSKFASDKIKSRDAFTPGKAAE